LVPVNEVEDMWFHALENNDNNTPEVTRFAYYVEVSEKGYFVLKLL
jgi:hypothetical protein